METPVKHSSPLGLALTALFVLSLSACGGGGSDTPVRKTISRVATEPTGTHCPAGGIRIEAGKDADGNGSLADIEVTDTQYVCNGATGLAALTRATPEPSSTDCAYGGTRLEIGVDADGDGVLDDAEVSQTSFVCSPAGVRWVQASASAVQAERNTGYLSIGSADITITLPAEADLAWGDLVSVSGSGTGRWTLAQNDGQTIYGGNLGHIGAVWKPLESHRSWQSVTCSADGTHLAAVVYGGKVYTSTDGGDTWTARDSDRLWYSIASSADGRKLVAAVPGGLLYTSTDGGETWTARESVRSWYDVASSADGSVLVAAAGGEQLYVSTDGGVTWSARDSNRLWFSVAASADGQRLTASEYGGQIYTSIDAGATWTHRETNRAWASLASSSDGLRLVSVVFGGRLFTSADAGVTWAESGPVGNWIGVSSSADGRRLVAIQAGGQIYTSADGGATWTPRYVDHNWSSVCSSSDGRTLLAVEHGGLMHRSTAFTTRGSTGGLSGGQYDTIELQYQGGGVFVPLGHEGELSLY